MDLGREILERIELMERRLEKRIDGLEKRMDGLEKRFEEVYQGLDRDILNLHKDLTTFQVETETNFKEVRQDLRWISEKWMEHDKEISRIKNRM